MGCDASSVVSEPAMAKSLLKIDSGMKKRSASVSRRQGQRPHSVHVEKMVEIIKLPKFSKVKKHVTKILSVHRS